MQAVFLLVCSLAVFVYGGGVYQWMQYDNFDRIIDAMDAVNSENCEAQSKEKLHLPIDAVSNLVRTNLLKTSTFQGNYYRNRTSLQQLHSTVLSNAYKYSYIYQRLNQTWNFDDQPSLFYYYLGLTADVTANLGLINGSAIFFDRDRFYPNFLVKIAVNITIPLFGPRSWRIDDYNDPSNWLREPTNDTFAVTDYGAGSFRNYTLDAYKINDWYSKWLPDHTFENDASKIDEISIDVVRAKMAGEYDEPDKFRFFGPPSPFITDSADKLPVKFTRPYFDCGRSNKWIVSAVAPIYDRLPRYVYDPNLIDESGIYDSLRSNKRVGVTVADTDFLNIDFNPCERYDNDDGDNYLAGTDRCHKESTICKPLFGFGYQRGGYICECRPGFRYPEYIQGPYMGVSIERATDKEYKAGFQCLPIGTSDMFVSPYVNADEDDNAGQDRLPGSISGRKKRDAERQRRETVGEAIKGITSYSSSTKRFLRKVIPKDYSTAREVRAMMYKQRRIADYQDIPSQYMSEMIKRNSDLGLGSKGRRVVSRFRRAAAGEEAKSRKKRNAFNPNNYDRAQQILDTKRTITKDTCLNYPPESWKLPGDTKFGVEKKFERFGRIALRLADFLSSFLQTVDGRQDYGTLEGDKLLKEEQLFSEVSAVIFSEPDVEGIGLFFDRDQFTTMTTDGDVFTKELFGPYAFTVTDQNGKDSYSVRDRAGDNDPQYTELEWFKDIKRRWSYNSEGLKTYVLNPWIRTNSTGESIRKHEEYPLKWQAAVYESGIWSDPYFDCKGYLRDWLISYRVPFFGNTGYGSAVEFRGVVTVDIKLDLLDIEQCPSEFFSSNAFMGTARCDYESTYCSHIENQGFQLHQGYRCDCKQGYEFPWETSEYFYTGDTINLERGYYTAERINRYERLTCRMSDAIRHVSSLAVFTAVILTFLLK